ncbi:MAG TPA: cell division protein FtsL [Candidatus Angelobacter sp.]
MAARALTGMITPVARRSVAGITPEFYFQKMIDNSRLVRVADPQRTREVRMFTIAVSVLFLMTMVYTLQHFRSLEYGYQIETQKTEHDRLVELNRSLTLEQASLRDPRRIAELARQMDLDLPHPGNVIRLDSDAPEGGPVIAQASAVAIIPGQ